MRIISWNVNGIKTINQYYPWIGRSFNQIIADSMFDADIFCIQEVKSTLSNLLPDMIQIPGYHCFYSLPKSKNGYSGVATFVKESVIVAGAEEGLCSQVSEIGGTSALNLLFNSKEIQELDSEGRCIITDHGSFVLFNGIKHLIYQFIFQMGTAQK